MKKNKIYDEKDILNNTVTGALTKLSKQMKVSRLIDDLRNEVATLKESLAARNKGEDWKSEALRLHVDENMSYRRIADQLGVSKTPVANYLKDK